MSDITWGGTLVTAGDVVFSGGRDGYFLALDARTGDAAVEGVGRRADQRRRR